MTNQLKLQEAPILEPAGLKPRHLWDLVDRYQRQTLKPPPHQRQPSWSDEKQRAYIQRLESRHDPPGAFETYQLRRDSTVFLNDGNNRLWTLLKFVKAPWIYQVTPERAEELLRACEVAINHHHYDSHREAHIDFIMVNFGSIPTPYEQLRGLLLYLGTEAEVSHYKRAWEDLHSGMHGLLNRLVSGFSGSHATIHKQYRHDLAMFFRYLTEDKALCNYGTSRKTLSVKDLSNGNLLEMRLIGYLEKERMDVESLNASIAKYLGLIEHEIGTIRSIWDKLEPNIGMQPVALRWLLDMAIWKKYAEVPIAIWVEFVTLFIQRTRGVGRIEFTRENDKPGFISLTLGDLLSLTRVCGVLPFNKERLTKPARPTRPQNLRGGDDNSHIAPGGQETFPEPSAVNRARGNRTLEEYDPLGNATAQTKKEAME